MSKTRLQEFYEGTVRPDLAQRFALKNVMEIPRINKIVVNVGLKETVGDAKAIQEICSVISKITGQRPVQTKARKAISNFKTREGMVIGIKVTLRKHVMYEFLDRLINLALPMVRDFQGVPAKLDGQGNYNLGLKDWSIFPEIDYTVTERAHGMNITMHTSTKNDVHAHALIKAFGMPFKREEG